MPAGAEPVFSDGKPGVCAVLNRTRAARMASHVRVCRSFLSRLRGLMLRRRLGEEHGALLVMTNDSRIDSAIHMLFVFFPLAVFWLDDDGVVISRVLARPWRPFYMPSRPARYVLELAASRREAAAEGDQLALEAARAPG